MPVTCGYTVRLLQCTPYGAIHKGDGKGTGGIICVRLAADIHITFFATYVTCSLAVVLITVFFGV